MKTARTEYLLYILTHLGQDELKCILTVHYFKKANKKDIEIIYGP